MPAISGDNLGNGNPVALGSHRGITKTQLDYYDNSQENVLVVKKKMPPGRPHRLVVLGTNRVGKTALIEHLIFGNHIIGLGGMKTLGDIYEAVIETENPAAEQVQIFDTPGDLFMLEPSKDESHYYSQEHYLSIADGFVLVYDITSRSSFDLVVTIKHKISMRHRECPIVVIGNKFDLDGIRDVNVTVSSQWAKTNGVKLYETSLLDRESLKEPFTYITWCVANPGRPIPLIFQSSPFVHSTRIRKSFTIQYQPRKYSGQEPLIDGSNPPSPDIPKIDETPNKQVKEELLFQGGSVQYKQSSTSIKSTNSTTFSEASLDSRISTHLCPDDATYPRAGLFGLADCMSSKNKP